MSLRLQINLIVTVLMALFSASMIGLQIDDTRHSVRDEVLGTHLVALQLLSHMNWDDDVSGLRGPGGMEGTMTYLQRLGRVRANEIALYDKEGALLYRSPPSSYKVGREAPQWYSRMVSSPLQPKVIDLPIGRITLLADPSRATLDGWDDLRPMLWIVLACFLLANALVYALIGRATQPLRLIVRGLQQMERGAYETRLPELSGREGRQIGRAFNAMAQSVQGGALARLQAQQATQALAANRELTQLMQTRIEQERGAIARELHDELGQQVTAIKSVGLAIARSAMGHDQSIEQSARLVMACADEIYDGVHRLISQLRPLALDRFGLRDALQDLLGDWRMRYPDTSFTLTLSGMLDEIGGDRSTAVYRIVQEAVNNALRHAQASRIDVDVQASADVLQLEVTDNGSGRVDHFQTHGHFGLLGMRERAQALHGSFDVDQMAPLGVRVRVTLPLDIKLEGGAN